MQLTQLYSKKSASTTFPRRSASLIAVEFSHVSPPSNSGAGFPASTREVDGGLQPSTPAANKTTHNCQFEIRICSAPDRQHSNLRHASYEKQVKHQKDLTAGIADRNTYCVAPARFGECQHHIDDTGFPPDRRR